uniref:Uncharacterized protein n=1 Tax=Arundo donax TaxID=35708 RepID=A0A0A8YL66_ARUDO
MLGAGRSDRATALAGARPQASGDSRKKEGEGRWRELRRRGGGGGRRRPRWRKVARDRRGGGGARAQRGGGNGVRVEEEEMEGVGGWASFGQG